MPQKPEVSASKLTLSRPHARSIRLYSEFVFVCVRVRELEKPLALELSTAQARGCVLIMSVFFNGLG